MCLRIRIIHTSPLTIAPPDPASRGISEPPVGLNRNDSSIQARKYLQEYRTVPLRISSIELKVPRISLTSLL